MKILWFRIYSDDVGAFAALAVMALILGGIVALGVVNARTKAACLKSGYPNADLAWNLEKYCVKRVDQTDIVVPFNERDAQGRN